MNPTRKLQPAFLRALALAYGIAGVFVLALVLTLASRHGVSAQETELPGVPADSVRGDFLRGSRSAPTTPIAPGAPGQPADLAVPDAPEAPRALRGPEDARTVAFRRRIHAGDNDVVQVGQDIAVERGEHILGHVFAMGGNITIRGMVDDDVVAMGGDVTLEDGATVRGDVVSLGGSVHKAPTATILGSNVTVGGLPRKLFDFRTLAFLGSGMKFLQALTNLLFWLFIGWIVILLSATRSRRVLAEVERRPAASIGWGILGVLAIAPATIVIALVAVLLVVTIIGIPVAVLLLLGYGVAVAALLLWGGVLGATAIGNWLVRRLSPRLGEPELMRSTLIGIVAMGILSLVGPMFRGLGIVVPPAALLGGLITFVGATIHCLAVLAGFGGVLIARAGQVDPIRIPWASHIPPAAPPGSTAPEAPAAAVPPQ
ncbi:MAG: hypothetical protein ABI960_03640 [Candidatus Eisenbacteria bacterium]